jgi:putative membrane protein
MKPSTRHLAATAAAVFTLLAASTVWAAGKLESADAALLKDIAQANIAEVESGKLAVEKSSNAEIKKFAQMMVDDHSKGLADVKTLASAKGTELPDGPDVKHKAVMVELKALKGDTFDSRYVKQAGVGDHEATEKLLKKTQAEAKDADLKALAGKMLPIVQGHLTHAQNLATSTAKK